jgi:hypothetical protein
MSQQRLCARTSEVYRSFNRRGAFAVVPACVQPSPAGTALDGYARRKGSAARRPNSAHAARMRSTGASRHVWLIRAAKRCSRHQRTPRDHERPRQWLPSSTTARSRPRTRQSFNEASRRQLLRQRNSSTSAVDRRECRSNRLSYSNPMSVAAYKALQNGGGSVTELRRTAAPPPNKPQIGERPWRKAVNCSARYGGEEVC